MLLLVLAGTMLVDSLEVALLGIALPAIRGDLGLSPVDVQWALTAFPLGFALALIPGRLLPWRHTTYLAALAVFGAAAVVDSLAPNIVVLALGGFVQGVCAALTTPAGMAVIGTMHQRAAVVYSLTGAFGATIGMLASGVLSGLSWRLAVLLPAPVVLLLLVAGWRSLPRDPVATPRLSVRMAGLWRPAVGAAALNGSSIALLIVANLQLQNDFGWAPWLAALAFTPAYVTLAFSGKMLTRWASRPLIIAGAFAAVLGYAFYLWQPTVLVTTVLIGVAYLCSFGALNQTAAATGGPAAGLVLHTAVQVGAVIVVPLATLLLTAYPGYRPALLLVLAAGLVGLGAALTGKDRDVHLAAPAGADHR